MKRYLNKNRLKIKLLLSLLLIGVLPILFNSSAKTKLEYYKELFGKEFGFKIFESDKEKANKKDYLSSDLKKGYVVALSSSLDTEGSENLNLTEKAVEKDEVLKKEESFSETEAIKIDSLAENSIFQENKVILICDSEFTNDYPVEFSCSGDFADSNEGHLMGNFLRIYEPDNYDFFVIPEKYLLTSDSRSDINNYFKAIKRSDEAPNVFEDGEVIDGKISIFSRLTDFKDTMVFEFFSIAFYMLILASLSWGLLSFLSKEGRKFDKSSFNVLLSSIKNLHLYQKIILIILILMAMVYIPLVVLIGLKDGQGLNLGYFVTYTKDTFNISKLMEFSQTDSVLRIVLFDYGLVFVELAFLFFVPIFYKVFKRAGEKISDVKIKNDMYKYGIPSLMLVSLITSSFIGADSSVKFLVFVIVLVVFLFVKNLLLKSFDYFYSSKEKLIIISVAVFIIFVGFIFRFKGGDDGFEYKEEDLIGVTDEVVFLPYSKQLGKNSLMNEYNFSGSEPIFVNQYLVYAPNRSRVENKNAKDFKNEGVFYIQNGDLEDIVIAINSNESLSNELMSDEPSNFFRIKNFERVYSGSNPEIQITFSCKRQDIGVEKIKIDFYYLENEEIRQDDKTLLYFPGCSKIGEPETFTVDLEIPYTDSEYLFMRLVDVSGDDIKEIKIIYGDRVYMPEYLSKGRGYEIIDSGGLINSAIVPVTNYIFGDSYDLGFDMTLDEEGKFNMADPINELIKEGILKDRFLIWSTKKYLPVRLP